MSQKVVNTGRRAGGGAWFAACSNIRVIRAVFVPVMFTPTVMLAQGAYTISSLPADAIAKAKQATVASDVRQQNVQQRVTLVVHDSTLAYVLRALTKSAGLGVAFNSQDAVYSKRVSVGVRDMEVMQAIAIVLKGTGLLASLEPNAETVLVRMVDTARNVADSTQFVIGKVVDSVSQGGIAGATVTVAGTQMSVVTKTDGSFRIGQVPIGSQSLTVKFLGYQSKTVKIVVAGNKTKVITVLLQQATTTLSEVVTTATGQQRRVEIPNDIVKIDAEKIMERAPVRSFTDLLEAAQIPGVQVTRGNGDPGAASKIRIRGLKSIIQSNDPVVIVDGNWIDASVGTPSGFDDIDPATIETIEIVRGPSASTLYGQDAANGVIVITTKKGRVGATRWRTSYQRNWGQTYGTMPLAYMGVGRNVITGQSGWCPIATVIEGGCIQDSVIIYDPNNPLLSREGAEATNRLIASVEGGTPAATYSITATTTKTTGVRQVAPIDMIRYRVLGLPIDAQFRKPKGQDVNTISTGLTMLPRSNMTVSLTVTGSQSDLSSNTVEPNFLGLWLGNGVDRDYSLDTVNFYYNGKGEVGFVESPDRRSNILFGSRMDWRAQSGWILSANAGVNRNLVENSSFTRNVQCLRDATCEDLLGSRFESSTRGTDITGRLNVQKQLNLGWFSRILDFQPSFGGDFRKRETGMLSVSVQNVPAGERSFTGGKEPVVQSSSSEVASAGWYANLHIGVLRRVYFDVGSRQDIGSAVKSMIGSGTRYPKLGGSWLVSDEPFWPNSSLIGNFRIRAALGYSAIQPDIADVHGRYTSNYEFVSGKFVRGISLGAVGNTTLKPERVMEVEMGFDTDLIGDRVTITANYAHSEAVNSMINRALPPSAGVGGNRKENIGRVRNRNFEATTQINAIDTRLVRLDLSHTLTLRENKVMALGDGVMPFSNSAIGRIQEGYPIAGIWVNQVLGFRDRNGDGLLARDEVAFGDSTVYVGWTQPRYEAGYGVSFTVLGRIAFDSRLSYRSHYVQQYTRNNKYGSEDVNAPLVVQADEILSSVNSRKSISDLRWNTASVTYHLPPSILHPLKLRALSVGIKGSNLALWTNYAGRDPSVNSAILRSEVAQESGNEIPQPRLFVLDFNLGL